MQRDVNTRTKQIDSEVSKVNKSGEKLSKDQKDRLRRAAVKEGEISRVTTKIADDLSNGGGNQPPPAPDAENDGTKN
jgi:hypothetical protein